MKTLSLFMLLVFPLLAFAGGELTKKVLPIPAQSTLLDSTDVDTLVFATPSSYGGYLWFDMNTNELVTNQSDSLTIQYARHRGSSVADTIANLTASLRYAAIDQGASLIAVNNYDFADSGWYCLRIDQEGADYEYVIFLISHTSNEAADDSLKTSLNPKAR